MYGSYETFLIQGFLFKLASKTSKQLLNKLMTVHRKQGNVCMVKYGSGYTITFIRPLTEDVAPTESVGPRQQKKRD